VCARMYVCLYREGVGAIFDDKFVYVKPNLGLI